MTVKEAIEMLQKIPEQNAPLYFDCPNCGRANEMFEAEYAVVTRGKKETKIRSA